MQPTTVEEEERAGGEWGDKSLVEEEGKDEGKEEDKEESKEEDNDEGKKIRQSRDLQGMTGANCEGKLGKSEQQPACGGCKSGRTTCCDLLPAALATRLRKMRKWMWEDLTKSHLIWIKLIFFFQSASLVVLYPYLVIHMRSLGLSTEEVAVVNGVIPAADMIGPPLAGFLADKIGNFRVFMSGLTFASGAASLLLLLIPAKTTQASVSHTSLTCCTIQPESWHCSSSHAGYMASPLPSPLLAPSAPPLLSPHLICTDSEQQPVSLAISAALRNSSTMGEEDCFEVFSCSGIATLPRDDWSYSLWAYIALRAIIDVLRASSCMMFEGAVMITIKQLGGDYGLQKLFGTFGAIIWGPVSGQIIDMASKSTGRENYAPVFWTFFAMRLICAALILKLNLSFKQPAKKVFKNLWKLILKPHIFMFLVVFFICGSVWGFLESYLFWFLEDLGSTKLTMGLSLAVGTIAGVPLTIGSAFIIGRLGNNNVIVLALALYCLRLLGYSFINSPMESLFFEVLKPFGNSLLMIAAMTYAKNNADISTMASLEGVMGALYFGVGKALGSLVGGLAIEEIGVRNTFRCFSLGSFVAASVYLCFTLLYGRRMRIAKEGEEEEGKKEASTDGKNDNEEEKGKEVTMSDKVNASVPELGGEGSRGT